LVVKNQEAYQDQFYFLKTSSAIPLTSDLIQVPSGSWTSRPWKMEAKLKILVLALLALLIGACATSPSKKALQLEEDWKGKNFNDLIAAKGPPDEKLDDGQGGKIFIYSSSELSPDSGSGGGMGRHSGGGSSRGGGSGGGGSSRGGQVSHINNEMFWINPDGFIYRTAYQRTGP
jgi:uncharacterized membrane protein YgcG